jgi:hypothetical protein
METIRFVSHSLAGETIFLFGVIIKIPWAGALLLKTNYPDLNSFIKLTDSLILLKWNA